MQQLREYGNLLAQQSARNLRDIDFDRKLVIVCDDLVELKFFSLLALENIRVLLFLQDQVIVEHVFVGDYSLLVAV